MPGQQAAVAFVTDAWEAAQVRGGARAAADAEAADPAGPPEDDDAAHMRRAPDDALPDAHQLDPAPRVDAVSTGTVFAGYRSHAGLDPQVAECPGNEFGDRIETRTDVPMRIPRRQRPGKRQRLREP